MIIAKLVELNLKETADKLLENVNEVIAYLKQMKWTEAEMKPHWFIDEHG
jgi:hypothetical protein